MNPEWYKQTFNRPAYLRLYEMIERAAAVSEAAAAVSLLQLRRGARVLDLACGYGRHVVELQRLGVRAFGVDLSELFLAHAAHSAIERQLPRCYVRSNLRSLPFYECFDAAFNFFLSFGYLDDEGNLQVLRECLKALRPGGRLLLDTWNVAEVIAHLRPKVVERRDDGVITERSRWVEASGRLEWSVSVRFRDGSRDKWEHSVRAYPPRELRAMLRKAGFHDIKMLGDWNGSEFTRQSPRLIVVAEK